MQTLVDIPLKLSVQAEGFVNEKHLPNSQLNLLFREGELTIGLLNAEKKLVLLRIYQLPVDYLDNFPEVFEQLIEKETVLQNTQSEVHLAVEDDHSSLVPADFFDAEDLKIFYPDESFSSDNKVLVYDSINPMNHYRVFALPNAVFDAFKIQFPNIQFSNTNSNLLSNLIGQYKNTASKIVIANIGKQKVDVVILQNSELLFHNTYPYKTPADFLYHLANCYRKEGLDMKENTLILLGNVYKSGGLIHMIGKYFSKVKFGDRPKQYLHNEILSNYPSHLYYELFAI